MAVSKYSPLDSEIMEAFGAFVVRWSYVDRMITSAFVNLLQADRALSYVVTQNVGINSVHSWLRTATEFRVLRYPELDTATKELGAILTHVEEVRAERNALVHGLWQPGPEPNTAVVQTVRLERREVLKEELVTLADLKHLNHEGIDIINAMNAAFSALGLKGEP